MPAVDILLAGGKTEMTQNPTDQKTCDVCHQRFNSDRELQEHQKNAHSQHKQGQPGSERNYNKDNAELDQQKREKIA